MGTSLLAMLAIVALWLGLIAPPMAPPEPGPAGRDPGPSLPPEPQSFEGDPGETLR